MKQFITDDYSNAITAINQRLNERYNFDNDRQKAVFAQMIKISEEVGELSEVVLAYSNIQRKKKLTEFDKSQIDAEIADVIMTVSILAQMLNIDINKAIADKLKKIETRGGL